MLLGNLNVNIDNQLRSNITGSFEKSVVKQHQRKSKSGKLSNVKEYTDKRQKKDADDKKERQFGKPKPDKVVKKDKWEDDEEEKEMIDNPYHKEGSDEEKTIKNPNYKEKKESKSDEGKQKKDKIEFRDFTREDWYGFGGAERFEDGSEPLIADINPESTLAIIDKDITSVFIDEGYGRQPISFILSHPSWVKDKKTAEQYAKLALSAMKKIDAKNLREAGWDEL